MVEIIALVKPFRAQPVLEAIEALGALAIRVREAKGFGRQKERLSLYLGSEYGEAFLPKVEISCFLPDDESVEPVIRAIIDHGRTGRMGDGKIFVMRCLDEHISW